MTMNALEEEKLYYNSKTVQFRKKGKSRPLKI